VSFHLFELDRDFAGSVRAEVADQLHDHLSAVARAQHVRAGAVFDLVLVVQ
jgi:hypothetical protein